jgi:hypothetical protein
MMSIIICGFEKAQDDQAVNWLSPEEPLSLERSGRDLALGDMITTAFILRLFKIIFPFIPLGLATIYSPAKEPPKAIRTMR